MTFRLRCLDSPSSDGSTDAATATPATSATSEIGEKPGVADVATVAVAAGHYIQQSVVPAVALRQALVEADLREHPDRHVAWDVTNAPLRPSPGPAVSVVIAVRTESCLVSGELHVPREQFDPALFLHTLTQTAETPA
jgi:hypothetical protein